MTALAFLGTLVAHATFIAIALTLAHLHRQEHR